MKTLGTIQTISKIAKIFSKIAFVFCVVGGIMCVCGIVSLAVMPEGIKIGGTTVKGLVEQSKDVNMGTLYNSLAVGAVVCAGYAILLKFSQRYFENELVAGTPFTFDGAKELMKLGIATIVVPLCVTGAVEIIYQIISKSFNDITRSELGNFGSVTLGLVIIIVSLICRYGAELTSDNNTEESEA